LSFRKLNSNLQCDVVGPDSFEESSIQFRRINWTSDASAIAHELLFWSFTN
jgi:hypothetical protein